MNQKCEVRSFFCYYSGKAMRNMMHKITEVKKVRALKDGVAQLVGDPHGCNSTIRPIQQNR